MNWRLGGALFASALLAGCAEGPDLFSRTPRASQNAVAAPVAQLPTDPSFRVGELRAGLTKAQLDAMYPGRLAFDSRDARGALYFVEPLGLNPNVGVERNRLVLWLNDNRLARFDVVRSTEPVAVADATGSIPSTARAMVPRQAAAGQPRGKYGVQIAAPRSEAEARAVLDAMRNRYAGLLGQQWATINRVELPGGVFYRVMIGPMTNAQQASQLCSSLKAQGAECFIRGT